MPSILSFLMSPDASANGREYPRAIRLKDGTQMTLRLMTPADAGAIASFARSLPEDDLLFLRMDITDPEAVAHWMRNLEAGLTTTVIAETGGRSRFLSGPRASGGPSPARSSPSPAGAACARSWPR